MFNNAVELPATSDIEDDPDPVQTSTYVDATGSDVLDLDHSDPVPSSAKESHLVSGTYDIEDGPYPVQTSTYVDAAGSDVLDNHDPAPASTTEGQLEPTSCCISCNLPGGAHKCIRCRKPVHRLENCSTPLEGEEEGYGQKRVCRSCGEPSLPHSSINSEHTYSSTTSVELASQENWKGLASQPKPRKRAYYWNNNPDYPQLLDISQKTNIGLLKNGNFFSLKPQRVLNENVTVTNTCAFDSATQIISAAYSDSELFRSYLLSKNFKNNIFESAIHLATKGLNASCYSMRAKILRQCIKPVPLVGGIIRLDVAMDAAEMVRKVMPACCKSVSTCSSNYCPSRQTVKETVVLAHDVHQTPLDRIQATIDEKEITTVNVCYELFTSTVHNVVPAELFVEDPSISKKVCLSVGVGICVAGDVVVVVVVVVLVLYFRLNIFLLGILHQDVLNLLSIKYLIKCFFFFFSILNSIFLLLSSFYPYFHPKFVKSSLLGNC